MDGIYIHDFTYLIYYYFCCIRSDFSSHQITVPNPALLLWWSAALKNSHIYCRHFFFFLHPLLWVKLPRLSSNWQSNLLLNQQMRRDTIMSIRLVEDICLFLQTDVSSNPPLFFSFFAKVSSILVHLVLHKSTVSPCLCYSSVSFSWNDNGACKSFHDRVSIWSMYFFFLFQSIKYW